MKLIGAGFGRTGTTSLKAALEQLGFAPCYHMTEVFKHPSHARTWLAAANGEPVDWRSFLGDYPATLDYPASNFYKELMVAFPDAKVLLSVRNPDRWYESTLETIYRSARLPDWLRLIPPLRTLIEMPNRIIWEGTFHGRFEERAYAIDVYQRHIREVKAIVPTERLLVFDVKEGWEPLCRFLESPVPAGPFPHLNDRERMLRMVQTAKGIGRLSALVAASVLMVTILRATRSRIWA